MALRLKAVLLAFLLFAPSGCGPRDPLDGLQPGEAGRVTRIIDGDALVLDTGLTVRLAALEAPARARRDRPGEPWAEESARVLESFAMGRRVRLYYGGLTRDRYDRAIAQVRTDDNLGPEIWLNLALVEEGAARVRIYPDNEALAEPLLAAEREARAERRGVWAQMSAMPVEAGSVASDARGFLLVEGWLVPAAFTAEGDRPVACVLGLGRVRIEVSPGASEVCAAVPGSRVRVRGWLNRGGMRVDSAANVETLSLPGER